MEDREIIYLINQAKDNFGPKCKKFSGSLTVEIIRQKLENHGICVSPRDVFIRGLGVEIDFLIPIKKVNPEYSILYEPLDVLVVFEIKNRSLFEKADVDRIRDKFQKIICINDKIKSAYVTLIEWEDYFKKVVTSENLGFPVYTLFWDKGSGKNYKRDSTSDWKKLLGDIKRWVKCP